MPIHPPAWGMGKTLRNPPHKNHVMKHYKGLQISIFIYQNLDEITFAHFTGTNKEQVRPYVLELLTN